MEELPETKDTETNADERRPSWPYPQFIIIFILLLLIAPALGVVTGNLLIWSWVAWYLWNALSKKAYLKMHASYPSLTRQDYILNMLLIPVTFVLLLIVSLWAIFG